MDKRRFCSAYQLSCSFSGLPGRATTEWSSMTTWTKYHRSWWPPLEHITIPPQKYVVFYFYSRKSFSFFNISFPTNLHIYILYINILYILYVNIYSVSRKAETALIWNREYFISLLSEARETDEPGYLPWRARVILSSFQSKCISRISRSQNFKV